eukprot:g4544.t1
MERTFRELMSSKTDLETKLQDLECGNVSTSNELQQTLERAENAESQLAFAQSDAKDLRERVNLLERGKELLRSKVSSFESEIEGRSESTKVECDSYRDTIERLEARLKEQEKMLFESKKVAAEKAEQTQNGVKLLIEEKEREIDALRSDIKTQSERLEGACCEKAKQDTIIRDLSGKVESAKTRSKELEDEYHDKVVRFAKEVETLQAAAKESHEKFLALKRLHDAQKKERGENDEGTSDKKDVGGAEEKESIIQAELDALRVELALVVDENKRLKSLLGDAPKDDVVANLRRELENASSTIKKQTADHARETAKLRMEMETIRPAKEAGVQKEASGIVDASRVPGKGDGEEEGENERSRLREDVEAKTREVAKLREALDRKEKAFLSLQKESTENEELHVELQRQFSDLSTREKKIRDEASVSATKIEALKRELEIKDQQYVDDVERKIEETKRNVGDALSVDIVERERTISNLQSRASRERVELEVSKQNGLCEAEALEALRGL